jgi:hypothetical protein
MMAPTHSAKEKHMESNARNTLVAKHLLLLYIGQMLMIFAFLILNFTTDATTRTLLTAGSSMAFLLVQLFVALRLRRVNREYTMALCAVVLNLLCWLLALLGLSVYNFVPMLSTVCEIAAIFYFCRGTDRERGHTRMASAIPVAYLICSVATFLTSYFFTVSQTVVNAVQVVCSLLCLIYAIYLRQSAQVIAKKRD